MQTSGWTELGPDRVLLRFHLPLRVPWLDAGRGAGGPLWADGGLEAGPARHHRDEGDGPEAPARNAAEEGLHPGRQAAHGEAARRAAGRTWAEGGELPGRFTRLPVDQGAGSCPRRPIR